MKWTGGYTDTKIEDDKFQVEISCNALTADQTCKNYLLYRCAELTLENGFDYFIISESSDNSGMYYSIGTTVGTAMETPAYNLTIVCGKGDKPKDNNYAYDAKVVQTNLKSKIGKIRTE